RQTSVREKQVHKLRRTEGGRERREESWPLHELECEGLLIIFQLLLPVPLIDDYAVANFLGVGQKLIEANRYRRVGDVAEGSFVNPIDQIAGVLKLDRKKERRRSIDALDRDASLIAAAAGNVIGPEEK